MISLVLSIANGGFWQRTLRVDSHVPFVGRYQREQFGNQWTIGLFWYGSSPLLPCKIISFYLIIACVYLVQFTLLLYVFGLISNDCH